MEDARGFCGDQGALPICGVAGAGNVSALDRPALTYSNLGDRECSVLRLGQMLQCGMTVIAGSGCPQ